MARIIEEKELSEMSNEQLLRLMKGKGVFLYLHDGKINEGNVYEIKETGNDTFIILFDTGQLTNKPYIKRIEIMDEENCPKL